MSRNPVRHDSRKHARATLALPLMVSGASNRAGGGIRFDSADVSGGGAFLRSELLFEIGEILTIEFDLPGGRHIRVQGRVVRVAREGGKDRFPGMGVEFVDLAPQDRTAIEERLHD